LAGSNNPVDKDDIGGQNREGAGKYIESMVGYDNDEDSLRWESDSDTELDELEAAGGLVDTGGGHGQDEPWREQRPNPGALVSCSPVSRPWGGGMEC